MELNRSTELSCLFVLKLAGLFAFLDYLEKFYVKENTCDIV